MKRLIPFAAAAALTGCVTAQPGADQIVLTGNTDQVRGCQLIRQVSVEQQWATGATGEADVMTMLRNEAVAANATHVLTLDIGERLGGMITNTRSTGRGELYRCSRR